MHLRDADERYKAAVAALEGRQGNTAHRQVTAIEVARPVPVEADPASLADAVQQPQMREVEKAHSEPVAESHVGVKAETAPEVLAITPLAEKQEAAPVTNQVEAEDAIVAETPASFMPPTDEIEETPVVIVGPTSSIMIQDEAIDRSEMLTWQTRAEQPTVAPPPPPAETAAFTQGTSDEVQVARLEREREVALPSGAPRHKNWFRRLFSRDEEMFSSIVPAAADDEREYPQGTHQGDAPEVIAKPAAALGYLRSGLMNTPVVVRAEELKDAGEFAAREHNLGLVTKDQPTLSQVAAPVVDEVSARLLLAEPVEAKFSQEVLAIEPEAMGVGTSEAPHQPASAARTEAVTVAPPVENEIGGKDAGLPIEQFKDAPAAAIVVKPVEAERTKFDTHTAVSCARDCAASLGFVYAGAYGRAGIQARSRGRK